MANQQQPDLWSLSDLATPWCIHVVATLGVAQRLGTASMPIAGLARDVGADSDSLQRVLRHLVARGLFEEPVPGHFALNEPAQALLHPGAQFGLNLDGFGGRMAHAWAGLLSAVRTGTPTYHTIFGRPFWEDLQAHPALAAEFDALMGPAGHGTPDPEVLVSGGWENVRTVVDVGGGTGALLAAVLRARPTVRGILVDLPATAARSSELLKEAGVADRVTAVGQSFFDPLPTGADLYLLKSILADWPDPQALAILKRCAEAAGSKGRVVLVNGVVPDNDRGAPPDLLMMVLVGGKIRMLSEFRELAKAAGLEIRAAQLQPSGRFIVECART